MEWWKWRSLKRHLERTRAAWTTDPTLLHPSVPTSAAGPTMELTDHNMLVLMSTSQHPLLSRFSNWLSTVFKLRPQTYTHVRWFLAYVFHPTALACLLIGLLGVLSVQVQLMAIGPLEAKYQAKATAAAADFSNTIAAQMNASMFTQSAAYAADINGRVSAIQTGIDDGVFGWIGNTTVTLNATLNDFYDDVQGLVSTAFKDTILEQPVQEFVRCFIGSKVDALENALTFLHDNLQIQLPRVDEGVLMLSPENVQSATRPIALAAIGDGNNEDGEGGGVVGKLVASYVKSLKQERIMFLLFIALWVFVCLIALGIIAYHSFVRGRVHEHKRKRWMSEKAVGVAEFAQTTPTTAPGATTAADQAWAPEQSFAAPGSAPAVKPNKKDLLRGFSAFKSSGAGPPLAPGTAASAISPIAPFSAFKRPPPPRRSSESYFDHATDSAGATPPTAADASVARRMTQRILAPLRRPTGGREVLVQDGESQRTIALASPSDGANANNKPWFHRLTTFLNPTSDDAPWDGPEPTRPALTVSTSDLNATPAPAPAPMSTTAPPMSAWSSSSSTALTPSASRAPNPWKPLTPVRAMSPPPNLNYTHPGSQSHDLAHGSLLPSGPKIFGAPPQHPMRGPEPSRYTPSSAPPKSRSKASTNPFENVVPLPLHSAFASAPGMDSPPPVTSPIYTLHATASRAKPQAVVYGHHAKKSSTMVDPFSNPFDDPRPHAL
jgi:hypothetical protein